MQMGGATFPRWTKEVEELLSGRLTTVTVICACQGTAPVARAVQAESSVLLKPLRLKVDLGHRSLIV